MQRLSFTAIAAAAAVALSAGAASADTAALTGYSGGLQATSGSDQLYGWFFDTSASINVTALGVGDADGHDLFVSHDVGIFDANTQNLLVSTTVPSGSGGTLLNGFRYESISPFTLAAGSYVIEMTMPQQNGDLQAIEVTSETTSSPVTYVNSSFGAGSTLTDAGGAGDFSPGLFGPNFTYESGAVPEPASWAMMLAGFGSLGAILRRRRAATALAAA